MATSTSRAKREATDALKQLTYLAGAFKAPRITEAAGRPADRPRLPPTLTLGSRARPHDLAQAALESPVQATTTP
jgi:hypothetical protein